ncbi:NUDIX hydrolase [Candidatus Kaiserbacteria bacterium]|nr:NUDIX hydrolase [Candidatus Kaiserbacteria bacterium]
MNPKHALSPDEAREFVRLLKKIQESDFWIPEGAWQETLRTFSRYACELVIVDQARGAPRILLTRYTGGTMPSHQSHFHIPGGFGRVDESLDETCSRVAKDELGIDVKFKKVVDVHKWSVDEGEAGIRPLSLYSLCEPLREIPQSESCRFFTREEMLALSADDMVTFHPHRAFLDRYLQQLESSESSNPMF